MSTVSNIEWTDATWNIARGCTKVDADCKFCYMYRDSMDGTRYDPKVVKQTKTVFDFPLKYKETKSKVLPGSRPLIFTCSLTDFFHPDIDAFRHEAWDIIRRCPHLIFQILTKRPERIKACLPHDWGTGWDNVWLGTSCGSQEALDVRGRHLMSRPAKLKFLSLDPLYGMINLYDLDNDLRDWHDEICWVIIGGESGNETGKYRYRECYPGWIDHVRITSQIAGVPVFVKQLGTHLAKLYGLKDRHGRNMDEWPDELRDLKVREFPVVDKVEGVV